VDTQQWTWAGQDRYPGFCLSLVEDRKPDQVAAALGADALRVMTLADADQRYPISEPGALLRLGVQGRWTFCFEDRAPIATRGPAIARLSQGTRLVQVVKSGDGMVIVRDMVDKAQVELFEPGGAVYTDGPLRSRVAKALGSGPAIVVALAVVAGEIAPDLDRATLEGPLATALSTLNEPAILR
jgi:hypothetical protein